MIVLLAAWLAPAWAADTGLGANLLGMGGVGAAASRDNVGVTLNPGLLALHERYDFQGQFQFGPSGGLQWGGSAVDGRTSKSLAAGIAYVGERLNPDLTEADLPGWVEPGVEITNVRRNHDFTGAIAIPLLERKVSVGVAGNLGWFDHDRAGSGMVFDLDAGIGIRPVEALTVGVAVRNVLAVSEDDLPPALRAAVRVESEEVLAVEANVERQFLPEAQRPESPLLIAAGLEKPIDRVRLRGGWLHDPYRLPGDPVNFATVGIGYVDQGGIIEYGLMIPLDHVSFAGTVHAVQLRFGAPAEIEEPD